MKTCAFVMIAAMGMSIALAVDPVATAPAPSSQPTAQASVDGNAVYVYIHAEGKEKDGVVYVVEGKRLDTRAKLLEHLQTRKHQSDGTVAFVADLDVRWQGVVEAYNAAAKAGYRQMKFVGADEGPPAGPVVGSSHPSGPATGPAGLPAQEPVVTVWNAGIHMLGVKPYLEFAAWEDGTVLMRRKDDPKRPGRLNGSLRIGRTESNTVKAMLAEIEQAGWFRSPVKFGLVRPDGPERRITVRKGSAALGLSYDGMEPDRREYRDFVALWKKVEAAIAKATPAVLTNYQGSLGLKPSFAADEAQAEVNRSASSQPANRGS